MPSLLRPLLIAAAIGLALSGCYAPYPGYYQAYDYPGYYPAYPGYYSGYPAYYPHPVGVGVASGFHDYR
jgi:hypothetical protein